MSGALPVLQITVTEDLRHCIERRERIINSIDSTGGTVSDKQFQFDLLMKSMEAENTKIVRLVVEQYRKVVAS